MDGVRPALDTRRIFLIDKHCSRHEHLGALLVMRTTTDVAQTALQCSLDNGHGVLGGIEIAVPCRLECGLGLYQTARDALSLLGGRRGRILVCDCNGRRRMRGSKLWVSRRHVRRAKCGIQRLVIQAMIVLSCGRC